MGISDLLSDQERTRLAAGAGIAPSHVNQMGGIDLASECSCARVPMIQGPCPCRCHESYAQRVARHRRLHMAPAGWCPACQAIKAGQAPDPLE